MVAKQGYRAGGSGQGLTGHRVADGGPVDPDGDGVVGTRRLPGPRYDDHRRGATSGQRDVGLRRDQPIPPAHSLPRYDEHPRALPELRQHIDPVPLAGDRVDDLAVPDLAPYMGERHPQLATGLVTLARRVEPRARRVGAEGAVRPDQQQVGTGSQRLPDRVVDHPEPVRAAVDLDDHAAGADRLVVHGVRPSWTTATGQVEWCRTPRATEPSSTFATRFRGRPPTTS